MQKTTTPLYQKNLKTHRMTKTFFATCAILLALETGHQVGAMIPDQATLTHTPSLSNPNGITLIETVRFDQKRFIPQSLSFSPDTATDFIVGGSNGIVYTYYNKILKQQKSSEDEPLKAILSLWQNRHLIINKIISVYDQNGNAFQPRSAEKFTTTSLDHAANRHLVLTSSQSGHLRLWKKQNDTYVQEKDYKLDLGQVPSAALYLQDPSTYDLRERHQLNVTAGTKKGYLFTYGFNGKLNWSERIHNEKINACAYSKEGVLASASDDFFVAIHDHATQSTHYQLHGGPVTALAFCPTQNILASGSKDKTVRLWNYKTRSPLAVLTDHTDDITTVQFNKDGSLLATGSKDKTVRIWSIPCDLSTSVPPVELINFPEDEEELRNSFGPTLLPTPKQLPLKKRPLSRSEEEEEEEEPESTQETMSTHLPPKKRDFKDNANLESSSDSIQEQLLLKKRFKQT